MAFSWVTIIVKNMEKSLAFYQDMTGLKINRQSEPMPGTRLAFLGFEGGYTEVELIQNSKNPNPVHGSDISIGFTVENLENKIEELKKNGITEIDGPYQPSPFIKFFYAKDPDGVKIQFIQNLN